MKSTLKKFFQAPLLAFLFLIIQSCITVETDMEVNKDLTGSSVSRISIMKGVVTEEQLKIEIEKLGFKKYELKKEKTDNSETDRYTVGINWKNEEELRKILKFNGSGSVLGLSEMEENLGKLSEQVTEGTNKDKGKSEEKKEVPKIFTKDKGHVIVNMGKTNINKLKIKVEGKITKEENKPGEISEKKDEIIFYQGEEVQFKYKEKGGFIGGIFTIIGIMLLSFLALVVFFIIKRIKGDKDRAGKEKDNAKTATNTDVEEGTPFSE